MKLEMLKSKLHQACVTAADVDYEGSLGIDVELMEAVGLQPYERILVANLANGERFETYAIAEPFGSRRIALNGAAARLGRVGDRIIIMSFCQLDESEVRDGRHRPKVIRFDENNNPVHGLSRVRSADGPASMLGV